MNPKAGIRVWRCHIIIAGCWECERGALLTLFSAYTRHPSDETSPQVSAIPRNLPMNFIWLDVSVSDKCTPLTSSVSPSWEPLREHNNRRGQRLFICAWKVRHRRAGHFTRVLLSIWLSTVEREKRKKLQPCLNSLTGGTVLPTALLPLLLIRMIRRATQHSRSFNHLCSHSWLKCLV